MQSIKDLLTNKEEKQAMVVVMNRIPVAEGREQEFEQTFTERDRAVDQVPGFVDLQVLRPSEGRTYVVMTRWKSREAFDAWTKSEAFISAHRKQSPGLAENRPTLEIYEVFTD
ncbi:MAG TPA: antibiotic biosynthesis monooxygenase [Pyrinomonadaceae bacterium]|nr:antibiotic biosynthesis monooxygenase [Pyrinomonadaceae bacterium]